MISADIAGFHSTVVVDMPDEGDTLYLNSGYTRIHAGAQFTGDGTLVQGFDISVEDEGEVMVDVETFDWGGNDPFNLNELRVEMGAELIVNSLTTGDADNRFQGEMTLAGGKLEVNIPGGWTLPGAEAPNEDLTLGILNMFSSEGFSAHVKGELLTAGGYIDVQGGLNFMDADLTLLPLSALSLTQLDSELRLSNDMTTLDGGFIFGLGTLLQLTDIHVVSDTFIDVDTFDWGNGITAPLYEYNAHITVDPGVTLTVNSDSTGEVNNPYRGTITLNGGGLFINTGLGIWTLPAIDQPSPNITDHQGVLNLNQPGADVPSVDGAALIVLGRINIDADRAELLNNVLLDEGSRVEFHRDGELVTGFRLNFRGANIDHNSHDAVITNGASDGIRWEEGMALTVHGDAGGSLTFALNAGATVNVPALGTPILTINPGPTLRAAGQIDPFTSNQGMTAEHVLIVNNSINSLHIDNALAVEVKGVEGVGNTVIGPGSSMTADLVEQNAVEVGVGASLLIRASGGLITTTAGLLNDGLVQSLGGDLTVSGPVEHNEQFHVSGGDELRFNGVVTGPGSFTGTGTVVFNGGTAPGASPAEVSFEGNVILGNGNTLFIDIEGTTPGAEYDQLNITGAASIGGALDVSLIGGFLPGVGDSFEFVTADAGLSGTFDNVAPSDRLDTLGGEGSFLVSYDGLANTVVLSNFLLTFIIGDMDCDGDVDFDDIDDFVLGLNSPQDYENQFGVAPEAKGDADGDGDLDFDDIAGFVAILAAPFPQRLSTSRNRPRQRYYS